MVKLSILSKLEGAGNFSCAFLLFYFITSATIAAVNSENTWNKLLSKLPQMEDDSKLEKNLAFKKILLANPEKFICKYPARAYLIYQKQPEIFEKLIEPCADIQEFMDKVPFDNLGIVFASEDIYSPASVMGHSFLKISGKDSLGEEKSYGISFLTNLATINPFELLYTTLISGRDGTVTLGATDSEIAKYVDMAKRTVWTADIDTNSADLKFLQLYIWELRLNTPDYLFVQFNCATFIHHLLSISVPDWDNSPTAFQTPRKLFKHAALKNSASIQAVPSIDWMVMSLRAHADGHYDVWVENADETIGNKQKTQELPLESLLFSINYTEKLRRQKKIENETALRMLAYFRGELEKRGALVNRYMLENVATPMRSTPPSKLALGVAASDDNNWITLSYRPVAKDLIDNYQSVLAIQENVLGNSVWSLNSENGDLKLNQLDILSMGSFIPYDRFAPNYSFRANFGFKRKISGMGITSLSYSGGFSLQLTDDVIGYALLGAGIGKHENLSNNGIATSELGFFVNLISQTSLWLSYKEEFWGFDASFRESTGRAVLQKKLGENLAIEMTYQNDIETLDGKQGDERFSISINKYF